MDPISPWPVAAWVAMHVGAIAAAWATRLAVGSRAEGVFQILFFGAMAGVGLAAGVGHYLELHLWAPSVGTLITMVLTAVVDFRRTCEPAHVAYHVAGR